MKVLYINALLLLISLNAYSYDISDFPCWGMTTNEMKIAGFDYTDVKLDLNGSSYSPRIRFSNRHLFNKDGRLVKMLALLDRGFWETVGESLYHNYGMPDYQTNNSLIWKTKKTYIKVRFGDPLLEPGIVFIDYTPVSPIN